MNANYSNVNYLMVYLSMYRDSLDRIIQDVKFEPDYMHYYYKRIDSVMQGLDLLLSEMKPTIDDCVE